MDPRWLEILKASGLQTGAVAVACFLILLADHLAIIPKLDPWMVQLASAAMVICALLSLASAASKTKWAYEKTTGYIKRRRALSYALDTLNPNEIDFLKARIDKGESTVQLNPFIAGSIPNFVHLSSMYQGLQSKAIVDVSAADAQGKMQTITIRRTAWKLLKKKFNSK